MWTIPMNMAPKSHPWGEKLRWPKQSALNSRLSKWMVLPGARPTPVGVVVVGDGTIRTSREEASYKSPYLAHQLSMFFAPARYRVVKIMCSYSKVVLQTMKNYKIVYPGSGPCYEVIVLPPAFFVLKKKNSVTMG
jgi:hypothetical protein